MQVCRWVAEVQSLGVWRDTDGVEGRVPAGSREEVRRAAHTKQRLIAKVSVKVALATQLTYLFLD